MPVEPAKTSPGSQTPFLFPLAGMAASNGRPATGQASPCLAAKAPLRVDHISRTVCRQKVLIASSEGKIL
ncbi:MAG: hypothetical protein M0R03_00555 [Novosphingobium sp.]|nr:hypothetical protein [Novosphingobium sp.]